MITISLFLYFTYPFLLNLSIFSLNVSAHRYKFKALRSHSKPSLLLPSDEQTLEIWGLSSSSDGKKIIFADCMNKSVKEFDIDKPALPPGLLYKSDWHVTSVRLLQSGDQLALLEKEPVKIQPENENENQNDSDTEKTAIRLSIIRYSTTDNEPQIDKPSVLIQSIILQGESDEDSSFILQRMNSHLLCSFAGLQVLYDLQVVPCLNSFQGELPVPVCSATLSICQGNETLFVSFEDRTVRGYLWEVTRGGEESLREVTFLQLHQADPWRLLWWPEQSALLIAVTVPYPVRVADEERKEEAADALELFAFDAERAALEWKTSLVSANEGLDLTDVIQTAHNRFALCNNSNEIREFKISVETL